MTTIDDSKSTRCALLNNRTLKWIEFKTLIISDFHKPILKQENVGSLTDSTLHKVIDHNYIVYYSRVIPSELHEQQKYKGSTLADTSSFVGKNPKSEKSKTLTGINEEYPSLMIFKTLLREKFSTTNENGMIRKIKTIIPPEEQYIVVGYKIKNSVYDERNSALKKLRSKIANLNYHLRYSEKGLEYQIAERVRRIISKSYKFTLRYIADMLGLEKVMTSSSRIEKLLQLYDDSNTQIAFKKLIESPLFYTELQSIVYKTIISEGLFPSFVEINTMQEKSYFLWVKKVLTNVVSAPWGSKHHASFSIGNYRYSFIYIPDDKSKQDRVNVALEYRREFKLHQKDMEYYRIKFFDFFPMDSWVIEITNMLKGLVERTAVLFEDHDGLNLKTVELLKYKVQEVLNESGEPLNVKIAREFVKRYNKELNEKLFKKLTELISDAEIRGYANFSNNCQTVVSEIVDLFCKHFQVIVEPLLDVKTLFKDDRMVHEKSVNYLLKFGSQMNKKFGHVGPFGLTHRLSYFGSYSDKDTSDLLSPRNFDQIAKMFLSYVGSRPKVKEFLERLEKEMSQNGHLNWNGLVSSEDEKFKGSIAIDDAEDVTRVMGKFGNGHDGTHKDNQEGRLHQESSQVSKEPQEQSKKNGQALQQTFGSNESSKNDKRIATEINHERDSTCEPSKLATEISLDLANEYSFVSHLTYIKYNSLFNTKKLIKIKLAQFSKYDAELQEVNRILELLDLSESQIKDSRQKTQHLMGKRKELEKQVQNLRKELLELFAQKYRDIEIFRETCFYYYNSIRLGVISKINDTTSYLGFLLIRNPEFNSSDQEGSLNESFIKNVLKDKNMPLIDSVLLKPIDSYIDKDVIIDPKLNQCKLRKRLDSHSGSSNSHSSSSNSHNSSLKQTVTFKESCLDKDNATKQAFAQSIIKGEYTSHGTITRDNSIYERSFTERGYFTEKYRDQSMYTSISNKSEIDAESDLIPNGKFIEKFIFRDNHVDKVTNKDYSLLNNDIMRSSISEISEDSKKGDNTQDHTLSANIMQRHGYSSSFTSKFSAGTNSYLDPSTIDSITMVIDESNPKNHGVKQAGVANTSFMKTSIFQQEVLQTGPMNTKESESSSMPGKIDNRLESIEDDSLNKRSNVHMNHKSSI